MIAYDHIQLAIPVGGEIAARLFYGTTLGLVEQPKPAELAARGGCWFAHGTVKLHLGVDPEFHPSRKAHLAFAIEDFSGLAVRLRAAGATLEPATPLDGRDRYYTNDPFGNRLEFIAAGTKR